MNAENGRRLPNGWESATFLETCFAIPDGGKKIPQKNYLKSGKYPVVDQGESRIGGYTDDPDKLFRGELPVITFGDHTRRFKYVDFPFAVGADGVKLLAPTSAWDSKCLWWFLQALKFEDRGYSRHFQFVRDSRLPLPPMKEQVRIREKLEELISDLDAGVAAMERVRAKSKRYQAAVLKAAVGGRLITTHKPYPMRRLSDAIKSVGQGWSPKCEKRAAEKPDEWAVVKTTAIQPLRFFDEHNKMLPGSLKPRPHLELQVGDLLITRAGPRSRVGIACMVKTTRPHLMLCDKVYRLRCIPDTLTPAFLEVVLNAPNIVTELDALKTGINDSGLNLTQDRLAELRVPFPSVTEQRAIVEAVEDQLSVVDHINRDLETRLRSAQALRQSILRYAFTGLLVPQDPIDEPASELLKRITIERSERREMTRAAKQTRLRTRALRGRAMKS